MSTTYNVTLSGVEYTCEVFTPADGVFSWTPPTAVVFYDAIIVAGGGGGAEQGNGGGAGGAGGVKVRTAVGCLPGVPITGGSVGTGGIGGTAGSPSPGTNGGNSTFDGVTSTGGGKGGAGGSGTAANNGGAGGSGGGGSGAIASSSASTGGAGSAGEGNNGAGGAGTGTGTNRNGGGGGGKGSAGTAGVTTGPKAGDGGTGYDASGMVGTGVGDNGWFGSGGGGGSNNTTPGTNGLASPGGGGAGGLGNGNGTNALPGTGGGGGGGGGSTGGASGDGGNGGDGVVIVRYVLSPPDAPTAVSASSTGTTSAELAWSAPVSVGSGLDHYEARRDGGAEFTATSPQAFTGLSPSTLYDLEVRSVGPGGESAWVSALVTTDAPPPFVPGYYRAELTLGSHSWSITYGDEVDLVADYPHAVLPIALGWGIPDSVEFFPAQHDLTTLSFRVQCNDASDLADVVKGTSVSFRMYVDDDLDADIWQTFDGIVVQLDGEVVASPADPSKSDFLVTVFAIEDTARLAELYCGFNDDWPIESIYARLNRIATEVGIDTAFTFVNTGTEGWLSPRTAGSAISALDAVRSTLKDAADHNNSEPPAEYYGRYVFGFYPGDGIDPPELHVVPFERRVYDTYNLDGGLVRAAGRFSKRPGPGVVGSGWVIVDGVQYGPGAGVPLVRNTSLLDYFGDPPGSEINYSAVTRDNLGNSLLSDGSTALDGWAAQSLVYEASVDPNPVQHWASPPLRPTGGGSLAARPFVRPVVIAPIGPELELNAVDYVAGTLTAARLLIPPGGRFVVEFRLRSELLPGTILP